MSTRSWLLGGRNQEPGGYGPIGTAVIARRIRRALGEMERGQESCRWPKSRGWAWESLRLLGSTWCCLSGGPVEWRAGYLLGVRF